MRYIPRPGVYMSESEAEAESVREKHGHGGLMGVFAAATRAVRARLGRA